METYLKDLANQIVKARLIARGIRLPASFIKRPEKVLYCGLAKLYRVDPLSICVIDRIKKAVR